MDMTEHLSTTEPSPALTHASLPSSSFERGLNLDLTLPTALNALLHYLINPLVSHYPHLTLLDLREHLLRDFTESFRATWDEDHPQFGSGSRSLICTKHLGLPRALQEAAVNVGVDVVIWTKVLGIDHTSGMAAEQVRDEWELWCDPGTVVCRMGGWEWEDVGFEPIRSRRGEFQQCTTEPFKLCTSTLRHPLIAIEPFRTIWQVAPTSKAELSTTQSAMTPARPSHAIPIRAPAVFQIPPTPAANTIDQNNDIMQDPPRAPSPSLLPAAYIVHSRSSSADTSLRTPSPVSSEFSNTSESESFQSHSRVSSNPSSLMTNLTKPPSRASSHRGTGSTSSIASSTSDSNSGASQLLTPTFRPSSAEPFKTNPVLQGPEGIKPHALVNAVSRGRSPSPNTPRDSISPSTVNSITPTVTPYDGGNVTVLGGGVKLGTSSRASSVMSATRSPIDRSRSPSISFASRALNTALSPNSGAGTPGSPRKPRTRRRIMPTYLGHLGQPGVGGPIMGVFGQFAGKVQPGTYGPPPGAVWPHVQPGVGVGVAPPPMIGGMGMRRIS